MHDMTLQAVEMKLGTHRINYPEAEPCNYIGNFICAMKSLAEICSTLDGLSNADKYAIGMCHPLILSHALLLMGVTESLILVG